MFSAGGDLYTNVFVGDTNAQAVYLGSDQVWPSITELTFGQPFALGFSPDGGFAYITELRERALLVVDTKTGEVLNKVLPDNVDDSFAGFKNGGITVDSGTGDVYAVYYEDGRTPVVVRVVDPVTANSFEVVVRAEGQPLGLAFVDGFLYVSTTNPGAVVVFDPSDGSVIETIEGFVQPFGMAFSRDGSLLYVADVSESVIRVVDKATNTIVDNIEGFARPYMLDVAPDGSLWVSDPGLAEVLVVKAGVIVNGYNFSAPGGIAVHPSQRFLWLVDQVLGTVTVFLLAGRARQR